MDLMHQLNLDAPQHSERPKESFPIYPFSVPSPLLPTSLANNGQADGFSVMPQRLTDVNYNGITRGQTFSMVTFKSNTWPAPQQTNGASYG